ncbi:MAG: FtsW/RodA/SpoVE family cell cycle protein, partial [Verrucomicrobia bacterium]|nr:FtsW/RodA/SpoVE family cell cycle protein [Verrucomicrobiota bacterium]
AYCDRNQRQMAAFKRGVALPGALASVILVLIFVEPDRGAAILLSTVTVAVLMVGGVCWKHILLPALGGAGIVAAEIWRDPLRMRRIMAWLHPQEHLNGAALQAQQAMIGLGSGGIFGVGLGNGVRKFGYLPEINTDFILANIGEELGLVATLAVVLLFVLIAICGITIALRAREPFGAFLAVGVTLLICLQAAINIGVVTSALPNKGLPLPFISYGGSNLVAMFACVGILFSVASRGRIRERVPAARDDAGYNPFAARVSA